MASTRRRTPRAAHAGNLIPTAIASRPRFSSTNAPGSRPNARNCADWATRDAASTAWHERTPELNELAEQLRGGHGDSRRSGNQLARQANSETRIQQPAWCPNTLVTRDHQE
jgi:hypothetical protein